MSQPLPILLDQLDAAIEATMTPAAALERRRRIEEAARVRREHYKTITHECARAIAELAEAIERPLVSVSEIERAIGHCQAARVASKELDK